MIKKLTNPFVLHGFKGKKYFCNRESELKLLREHVLNNRNFTLFGWRRLGKTVLLYALADILEKKHQVQTVMIDISACRSQQEMTLKAVDVVYEKFGAGRKGIRLGFQKLIASLGIKMGFDPHSGMPEFSLGYNTDRPDNKLHSLQAVASFLEEQDQPVLLVFDEFQQINHFRESNTEAELRGLTQKFPSLHFAFCGSHKGIIQSMFSSYQRPFYKSTQLLDIKTIDESVYVKFILKKFSEHGKSISETLASEIYSWCNGETYSIQVICNRLFFRHDKPENEDFINITKELMQEQKRAYTEWLNLLSHAQVQLLKAIAREEPAENITGKSFIMKYSLGVASSVQSAIKSLLDKEIVFKEDGQYRIHDVLFQKWLRTL
ncbi:MAG: ATP-binding protein [Chitinophagales bacterium]